MHYPLSLRAVTRTVAAFQQLPLLQLSQLHYQSPTKAQTLFQKDDEWTKEYQDSGIWTSNTLSSQSATTISLQSVAVKDNGKVFEVLWSKSLVKDQKHTNSNSNNDDVHTHLNLHDPFNVRSYDDEWRSEWHSRVLDRFHQSIENSKQNESDMAVMMVSLSSSEPHMNKPNKMQQKQHHSHTLKKSSSVSDLMQDRAQARRAKATQRFKDNRCLADIVNEEMQQIIVYPHGVSNTNGTTEKSEEETKRYDEVRNWTREVTQEVMNAQVHDSDDMRLKGVKLCSGVARSLIVYPPPPKHVLDGLSSCMEDRVFGVRLWAAISYVVNADTENERALTVLKQGIEHAHLEHRWDAARCLASIGVVNAPVVTVLTDVFGGDVLHLEIQARNLLIELSQQHPYIVQHTMNMLLSENAHQRNEGVFLLPHIQPFLTHDQVSKLIEMMWDDSSEGVQDSCFKSLVKGNHTSAVYDSMELRLHSNKDRIRAIALTKIGYLKKVPRRLIKQYIESFTDTFTSVRSAAVKAAACLITYSPSILDAVMDRISNDPIAQVRFDAIQTMQALGIHTSKVHGLISWAVRYEAQPLVVRAACNFITSIDEKEIVNDDLRQAVLWRLYSEKDEAILNILQDCQTLMGWSSDDCVAQEQLDAINNTMKTLCSKEHVLKGINESPKDPLGFKAMFG
eukprot:m.220222 g.220222  ORF g.220222 m.220222 type:complete len:678 (+) comp13829_c2_seq1:194-2227(+)